jgi:hypothetical protein
MGTAAVVPRLGGLSVPTYTFYTEDLKTKWGFVDGDQLGLAMADLCVKHGVFRGEVTRKVLLHECLVRFVIPQLDPPQPTPKRLVTQFNPTVISYKGKLTPDSVTVPTEFIEMVFLELVEEDRKRA